MQLIYEKSVPGRRAASAPNLTVPVKNKIDKKYLRNSPAELPEVPEIEVVRHFTKLSRRNFSVDTNFYPLGSCTMKYNPKASEAVSALPGFAKLHPCLPQLPGGEKFAQGALELLYETERALSAITGMNETTLQPLAGAHGELTGALIMAAWLRDQGTGKKQILVPDSAHGTNPASAVLAGFEVVTIPSNAKGTVDAETVKAAINENTAGMMMTNPNTLGLFEPEIEAISALIHDAGGLMYYDGANLNAVLGRCKPSDMGFDICHLNLHKTFSTPHGGGGPGAGPVGVIEKLTPYLPVPRVIKNENQYALLSDDAKSIGLIAPFYGNFSILIRTYAYTLLIGKEGLRSVSNHAVLNANYLQEKLRPHFSVHHQGPCMHEFVLSIKPQQFGGARALDFAKGLIDHGIHPPTVYFPLIVPEAMMIEPTESETKETLDGFVAALLELAETARKDPAALSSMPQTTPVGRLDEVAAARNKDLASLP